MGVSKRMAEVVQSLGKKTWVLSQHIPIVNSQQRPNLLPNRKLNIFSLRKTEHQRKVEVYTLNLIVFNTSKTQISEYQGSQVYISSGRDFRTLLLGTLETQSGEREKGVEQKRRGEKLKNGEDPHKNIT